MFQNSEATSLEHRRVLDRFLNSTHLHLHSLSYLLALFISRGGRIHRSSIQHISQVVDGAYSTPNIAPPPSAVVVCAGLGARFLGGVEDKAMYPIRGQTVLLRAPWVRFGRTTSSTSGLWTYIIPRRSGDVSRLQRLLLHKLTQCVP